MVDPCFVTMLTYWLLKPKKINEDSFQNLVDALESPPVDHNQIANKLKSTVKTKRITFSQSMGEFDQYNNIYS